MFLKKYIELLLLIFCPKTHYLGRVETPISATFYERLDKFIDSFPAKEFYFLQSVRKAVGGLERELERTSQGIDHKRF